MYRPLSISIYVQDLTVMKQSTMTTAAAVQTVSPAQAAVMQSLTQILEQMLISTWTMQSCRVQIGSI